PAVARADGGGAGRAVRAVREVAGEPAEGQGKDGRVPDDRGGEAGSRRGPGGGEGRPRRDRGDPDRNTPGRQRDTEGVVRRRGREGPLRGVLRHRPEEVTGQPIISSRRRGRTRPSRTARPSPCPRPASLP